MSKLLMGEEDILSLELSKILRDLELELDNKQMESLIVEIKSFLIQEILNELEEKISNYKKHNYGKINLHKLIHDFERGVNASQSWFGWPLKIIKKISEILRDNN